MRMEHGFSPDEVRRMTDYQLDYWMRPADQKMRRESEVADRRAKTVEQLMRERGDLKPLPRRYREGGNGP